MPRQGAEDGYVLRGGSFADGPTLPLAAGGAPASHVEIRCIEQGPRGQKRPSTAIEPSGRWRKIGCLSQGSTAKIHARTRAACLTSSPMLKHRRLIALRPHGSPMRPCMADRPLPEVRIASTQLHRASSFWAQTAEMGEAHGGACSTYFEQFLKWGAIHVGLAGGRERNKEKTGRSSCEGLFRS